MPSQRELRGFFPAARGREHTGRVAAHGLLASEATGVGDTMSSPDASADHAFALSQASCVEPVQMLGST